LTAKKKHQHQTKARSKIPPTHRIKLEALLVRTSESNTSSNMAIANSHKSSNSTNWNDTATSSSNHNSSSSSSSNIDSTKAVPVEKQLQPQQPRKENVMNTSFYGTTSSTGGGAVRRIRVPGPNDVLSGRGGQVNAHVRYFFGSSLARVDVLVLIYELLLHLTHFPLLIMFTL
jgi:membrane-bound lytic murein transglycosylase